MQAEHTVIWLTVEKGVLVLEAVGTAPTTPVSATATTVSLYPSVPKVPTGWTRILCKNYEALYHRCCDSAGSCQLSIPEIASRLGKSKQAVSYMLAKFAYLGVYQNNGYAYKSGNSRGVIRSLRHPAELFPASPTTRKARSSGATAKVYDSLTANCKRLLSLSVRLFGDTEGTATMAKTALVDVLVQESALSQVSVYKMLKALAEAGLYVEGRNCDGVKTHTFTEPLQVLVEPWHPVKRPMSRLTSYTHEAAREGAAADALAYSTERRGAKSKTPRSKPSVQRSKPSKLGPKYTPTGYCTQQGTSQGGKRAPSLPARCTDGYSYESAECRDANGRLFVRYGERAPTLITVSTFVAPPVTRGKVKASYGTWCNCDRAIDYQKEVLLGSLSTEPGTEKLSSRKLVDIEHYQTRLRQAKVESDGLVGIEQIQADAAEEAHARHTANSRVSTSELTLAEKYGVNAPYVLPSRLLKKDMTSLAAKVIQSGLPSHVLAQVARIGILANKLEVGGEYAEVLQDFDGLRLSPQYTRRDDVAIACTYANELFEENPLVRIAVPQPPRMADGLCETPDDLHRSIRLAMLARCAVQEHFTGKRAFTPPSESGYLADVIRLYAKLPKLAERFSDVYRFVHWRMELYYMTNQEALLTKQPVPLKFIFPRKNPVNLEKGSVLVTHPKNGERIQAGIVMTMPASKRALELIHMAARDASRMKYTSRLGSRLKARKATREHMDAVFPPEFRSEVRQTAEQQAEGQLAEWRESVKQGHYIW